MTPTLWQNNISLHVIDGYEHPLFGSSVRVLVQLSWANGTEDDNPQGGQGWMT